MDFACLPEHVGLALRNTIWKCSDLEEDWVATEHSPGEVPQVHADTLRQHERALAWGLVRVRQGKGPGSHPEVLK